MRPFVLVVALLATPFPAPAADVPLTLLPPQSQEAADIQFEPAFPSGNHGSLVFWKMMNNTLKAGDLALAPIPPERESVIGTWAGAFAAASRADGGAVIAWWDIFGSPKLMARAVRADGTPDGPIIDTGIRGTDASTRISMAGANGRYLLTWVYGDEIRGVLLDDNAHAAGPPMTYSGHADAYRAVSVVAAGDRFLLAWIEALTLRYQFLDARGQPSSEARILGPADEVEVTSDAGSFILTWQRPELFAKLGQARVSFDGLAGTSAFDDFSGGTVLRSWRVVWDGATLLLASFGDVFAPCGCPPTIRIFRTLPGTTVRFLDELDVPNPIASVPYALSARDGRPLLLYVLRDRICIRAIATAQPPRRRVVR